jgi:hypothetical protein
VIAPPQYCPRKPFISQPDRDPPRSPALPIEQQAGLQYERLLLEDGASQRHPAHKRAQRPLRSFNRGDALRLEESQIGK